MKHIIRISILVILFLGTKNKCVSQDLTLRAEIIDVGWSPGFECNLPTEYISVKIILKNSSNIPQAFWIMRASWQESFITDVENVEFLWKQYTANFPKQKELQPNQSITFKTLLKFLRHLSNLKNSRLVLLYLMSVS